MTAASPGRDCPRWTTFLHEITEGDTELQAYLSRLAGYCLTGSTREQAFAFVHGHGANGKSVFLQTLASVMGSYAATAAPDTFMASRGDRHLTELAGLRAARLVLVSETDAGRNWAEARIKAVTGGERVRANFMRCDHFEFIPQFKLLVAGNHQPSLTAVGEAMRRRLHLVPFTVTIPPDRRDPRLAEKLLADDHGGHGPRPEGLRPDRRSPSARRFGNGDSRRPRSAAGGAGQGSKRTSCTFSGSSWSQPGSRARASDSESRSASVTWDKR